ncbi:MAG TPA: hypothetical protein P5516_09310, partial [Anaerolineaceae bacterium]|nr:hypothetical protein [Anaerolineaceae bacterium]
MSNLSEICSRLNAQFFDLQNLAIPTGSQEEAVREALAGLNAFLDKDFTVAGLDGAVLTTLPSDHEAVLLFGAAAFALDFSLRSHLVHTTSSTVRSEETLRLWCEHLNRQFDAGLDRLRLQALQANGALPYSP